MATWPCCSSPPPPQPRPRPREKRSQALGRLPHAAASSSLSVCLAAALFTLAATAAFLKPWQRRGSEARPAATRATGEVPRPGGRTDRQAPLRMRREDIPPRLLALAGGG